MVKDISFIGRPHEYDARRVYSLTGADWQERVNFERLRKERLARAKEQMELHDLGALVVYDGANIRYLTSSFQGNWKYNIFIRYAVLPRGGEPILFETAGSDLVCAKMDLPWSSLASRNCHAQALNPRKAREICSSDCPSTRS